MQYCRRYRPRAKPARKSHWGSKRLQRDGGSGAGRKGVAAGQQVLPWGGPELPLPLQWQQLAERFRRADGARAREAKLLS
jgi:putative transposase